MVIPGQSIVRPTKRLLRGMIMPVQEIGVYKLYFVANNVVNQNKNTIFGTDLNMIVYVFTWHNACDFALRKRSA